MHRVISAQTTKHQCESNLESGQPELLRSCLRQTLLLVQHVQDCQSGQSCLCMYKHLRALLGHTCKHCSMAGPVRAPGMAATYASACVASTADTSNCTRTAVSQQQEELAPAVPQAAAVVSLMLRGMTLEASAGAKPSCVATQLAKKKAGVPSEFTPHSCSSVETS
jgi:hypothetical protein